MRLQFQNPRKNIVNGMAYLRIDTAEITTLVADNDETRPPFKLTLRHGSWKVPANAWFF